jgi:hypothetical protein
MRPIVSAASFYMRLFHCLVRGSSHVSWIDNKLQLVLVLAQHVVLDVVLNVQPINVEHIFNEPGRGLALYLIHEHYLIKRYDLRLALRNQHNKQHFAWVHDHQQHVLAPIHQHDHNRVSNLEQQHVVLRQQFIGWRDHDPG